MSAITFPRYLHIYIYIDISRALLRKSKILLLDEATSSVDQSTDALIQATIRHEFSAQGCTVLVVAHRLAAALDADRVLVMVNGKVGEVGTPDELMRKEGGLLAQLVAAERDRGHAS